MELNLTKCLLLPQAEWTVTHRPPFDWPRHGEVKFRNYESEASFNCTPALRGINLTILKGEKVF